MKASAAVIGVACMAFFGGVSYAYAQTPSAAPIHIVGKPGVPVVATSTASSTRAHVPSLPTVRGIVVSASSTTLTIAVRNGKNYLIDIAGAPVQKRGATATVADISLGDELIVTGVLSAQAVAAVSIEDLGVPPAPSDEGGWFARLWRWIVATWSAITGRAS
jgi:hypothetical protein